MDTPKTATVEVTQDALEALAQDIFKHGHSEGWRGNQMRRDVQHVDADKGWSLYVSNGALAKMLARHRTRASRQDGLREALIQHNERLRSAVAIADRDGADTNWLAFRGQCRFTLAEYQDVVNEARAALSRRPGYAPGNYSITCIDCRKECHDCDKRAIRCADCAAAPSDSSTREESGADEPVALLHVHEEDGEREVELYRHGAGSLTEADIAAGWTETPLYAHPPATNAGNALREALERMARRIADEKSKSHGDGRALDYQLAYAAALAALSDSSTREESGAGIDLNRFIFEWFNARDPKEMTECIDEYDRRAALSASPEGEG